MTNKKLDKDHFIQFISTGRRMMPAFSFLKPEDKDAIAAYVLDIRRDQKKPYHTELSESGKIPSGSLYNFRIQ